jgi:hypothetical protein
VLILARRAVNKAMKLKLRSPHLDVLVIVTANSGRTPRDRCGYVFLPFQVPNDCQ